MWSHGRYGNYNAQMNYDSFSVCVCGYNFAKQSKQVTYFRILYIMIKLLWPNDTRGEQRRESVESEISSVYMAIISTTHKDNVGSISVLASYSVLPTEPVMIVLHQSHVRFIITIPVILISG